MFITHETMCELTGYVRFADQRRWLTRHAWKFEESATGRPIVSAAYAEAKLSEGEAKKGQWTPNFAAFARKSA